MKVKKYVSTPCSAQYRLFDLQSMITDKFSQLVGAENISNEIYDNVSNKNVNEAENFIALSSCPSFYARLYWLAIYGPKTRIPILAADIIKKAKEEDKIKARRIFAKISSVLGFEHITFHGEKNTTLQFEHSINVKGEQTKSSTKSIKICIIIHLCR